jgi:hypothetical protein
VTTNMKLLPSHLLADRKRRWLRLFQQDFKSGRMKGQKNFYLYDVGDQVLVVENQPLTDEQLKLFAHPPTQRETLSYTRLHTIETRVV